MKIKLSIRAKMMLFVLCTTVLIFALTVSYLNSTNRSLTIDTATKLALTVTQENALKVQGILVEDYATLQTLANVFTITEGLEEQQWKEVFVAMSSSMFRQKGNFFGLSVSWEEDFYKPDSAKNNSRYYYHIERNGDVFTDYIAIRDLTSPFYQSAKTLNQNALMESSKVSLEGKPYFRGYISCPMHIGSDFFGYVVGDFSTDGFQKLVSEIQPYESAVASLISNKGIIVSHPDTASIGDTLMINYPHYEEQFQLSTYVKEGQGEVFNGLDENNNKTIIVVAPILIGEYNAPWALMLTIPVEVILEEANRNQRNSLIVSLLGILLVTIIIYIISKNIGFALNKTTRVLEKLAKGDIENVEKLHFNRGDEIDVMVDSLNSLKVGLDGTSEFADQIGKGNLDAGFEPLSANDKLGNSLIEMKNNLLEAKEAERKMKLEEEKNTWVSEGLAKFGEIIRLNNEDIGALTYNVVKNFVDYLGVPIGALFVVENEDDEVVYQCKAAIAYNRKKLIKEKFRIGEGLIGRCVFEKHTIYMKDVPPNYIEITSGLGEANPDSLLIVPLMFDDKVYGVIELASFHEIEDYKISYVEKLAESIASTLSNVQNNEQTKKLLEQSKMQSEELAAQEEEMRQNMEELQATQEEAARREQELQDAVDLIDNTIFKVEYDLDGQVLNISNKYSKFLYDHLGSSEYVNFNSEYEALKQQKSEIDEIWSGVLAGTLKSRKLNVVVNNKNYQIEENYSLSKPSGENQSSKVVKISYLISNS